MVAKRTAITARSASLPSCRPDPARSEMPSGLSLPLAFGMNTRLIGSGRYVSFLSASASSVSHVLAAEIGGFVPSPMYA
jgi:hypothetical protein